MRRTTPHLCRTAAFLMLAAFALSSPPLLSLARAAQPGKSATKAEAAPQGEPVEISGRVAIGLDKVFIKDAQGYCLVQGLDLTPFAGRHIQAKGLVIRQDQEYRTVRLLEYRIVSPDDDSPGAGGAVKQTGADKKKK